MITRFRSRALAGRNDYPYIDAEGLSQSERLDWLYYNTEWGGDFDPDRHAKTMIRIWEADNIPNQEWAITCKRRRNVSGIARLQQSVVDKLTNFPSAHTLETVVLAAGFGGGEYSVSSTRGPRVTHRITIGGERSDPLAPVEKPDPKTEREEVLDELETRMLNIAVRYLEDHPAEGLEVSLKWLEKRLGIKIRMPDRNAPVPYGDLPVDYQDWLEDHFEEKDAYMRKCLGLPEPEVEPTMEERVVEGIEEKLVEGVVASFDRRPSGLETMLAELVAGNDLMELIDRIGPLLIAGGQREAGVGSTGTDTSRDELPPVNPPHTGFSVQ